VAVCHNYFTHFIEEVHMSNFSDINKRRKDEEEKYRLEQLRLQQENERQQKILETDQKEKRRIARAYYLFAKKHSAMISRVLNDFANSAWGRNPFWVRTESQLKWTSYELIKESAYPAQWHRGKWGDFGKVEVYLEMNNPSDYYLVIILNNYDDKISVPVDEKSIRRAIHDLYFKS
jgi:hypothetical protein